MDKVKPSENHPMPISNNDDNTYIDENPPQTDIVIESIATTTRLTPELIMRAEIEVNEKDAWRLRDIEALREMIRGCYYIDDDDE